MWSQNGLVTTWKSYSAKAMDLAPNGVFLMEILSGFCFSFFLNPKTHAQGRCCTDFPEGTFSASPVESCPLN